MLWKFIHNSIRSECDTSQEIEKEGIITEESFLRRSLSNMVVTEANKRRNTRLKRSLSIKSLPNVTSDTKSIRSSRSLTFVPGESEDNYSNFEDQLRSSLKRISDEESLKKSIKDTTFDNPLNDSVHKLPPIFEKMRNNIQMLGCMILTNLAIDNAVYINILQKSLVPLLPPVYEEVLLTKLFSLTRLPIPSYKIEGYRCINKLFDVSDQYNETLLEVISKVPFAEYVLEDFTADYASINVLLLRYQLLTFLLNISKQNEALLLSPIYRKTGLFSQIISLWEQKDSELYPLCQQFIDLYFGSNEVDIYSLDTDLILSLIDSKSYKVVLNCVRHCSYAINSSFKPQKLTISSRDPLNKIAGIFSKLLLLLENTILTKLWNISDVSEVVSLLLATIWGLIEYNVIANTISSNQLKDCFVLLSAILLSDKEVLDNMNITTIFDVYIYYIIRYLNN